VILLSPVADASLVVIPHTGSSLSSLSSSFSSSSSQIDVMKWRLRELRHKFWLLLGGWVIDIVSGWVIDIVSGWMIVIVSVWVIDIVSGWVIFDYYSSGTSVDHRLVAKKHKASKRYDVCEVSIYLSISLSIIIF
jgi:hypothetical protein